MQSCEAYRAGLRGHFDREKGGERTRGKKRESEGGCGMWTRRSEEVEVEAVDRSKRTRKRWQRAKCSGKRGSGGQVRKKMSGRMCKEVGK